MNSDYSAYVNGLVGRTADGVSNFPIIAPLGGPVGIAISSSLLIHQLVLKMKINTGKHHERINKHRVVMINLRKLSDDHNKNLKEEPEKKEELLQEFEAQVSALSSSVGGSPSNYNSYDDFKGGSYGSGYLIPKNASPNQLPSTYDPKKDVLEQFGNNAQYINQYAKGAANELADKALQNLQAYYSVLGWCRSATQTEYGFDKCMNEEDGYYYGDKYAENVGDSQALDEAYKGLIADMIRELLRQCYSCEEIWNSLTPLIQDMFYSQSAFMSACQEEREMMASQEPCCLKRLCCYDYRG